MATNQTSLFDGVTCTPLTSELGASNTFLFLVGMVVSSSVCVALEEVVVAPDCFYDTLCFPDIQNSGSPIQHTLRLLDSWRSSASKQSGRDGHAESPKTSSP